MIGTIEPPTAQTSVCQRRRHGGYVFLAIASLHCAVIVRADDATEPVDVAFVARCDGTTQHYVMLLPEGFRNDVSHDLLIALHGHGADRWQFVRDGRPECKAARDAAAEHKMIFISPDYRARTSWMGPKADSSAFR